MHQIISDYHIIPKGRQRNPRHQRSSASYPGFSTSICIAALCGSARPNAHPLT